MLKRLRRDLAHARPRTRPVKLLAAVLASTALAGPPVRGPWLLTAIPSVGAVRWSCTAASAGLRPRHRLELDAEPWSATDVVTFAIGGRVVAKRNVQPGDVWRLPWTRALRMTLRIEQGSEARDLKATVEVDFGPAERASGACYSYFPPAVTTTLAPYR
jgi:hypothetical protein